MLLSISKICFGSNGDFKNWFQIWQLLLLKYAIAGGVRFGPLAGLVSTLGVVAVSAWSDIYNVQHCLHIVDLIIAIRSMLD